ncbi:TPA: LysM-like peptidoglycan-binding domain-containing protein, partial [Aeromonas veronii]
MDELTQSEVKKVDAQPNIGAMHEQDLQQAADWYRKAAEQGNAEAQFALGQMYENGQGVLQDHQQAAIWYRKAAEQGYADAQFQLGRIYHKNQTEPSNLHVAPWYREAPNWVPVFLCKHRYALAVVVGLIVVAIFLLPATEDILERPLGLELPITATDASANENNSDSNDIPIDATLQWQSYLVRNGENLTAIFNNLGLSTTTLYKVLDADNNNVLARLKPGQTIELQIGQDNILQQLKIRLNIKQTLLMVHSDDAYTASMINEKVEWQLQRYNGVINGSFYVSARNAGIPANHIQKIANLFQWRMNFAQVLKKGDTFKVLVRQEVVEGKSTGDSQLLGVEVTNQGNQVSAWLAEDGNYYDGGGNSLEQRKPARSSVESSRTELSMAEPLSGKDRRRFLALVEQYRQALNSNGEGELKLRLVNIPLPGLEAITKYRKAAEQGNASAQYNLGLMYEQGHGVAQDYKQAVSWYRKAAEQGNASAQYNLGLMYEQGHGVVQDNKEAIAWYRKAAEQGD